LSHNNLVFWEKNFRNWGQPDNYTTEVSAGGERIIFTADPENIKAILATQFQDYGKGKNFNKDWHDFLGDGIFATDGEKWHESRQLIRPQFIKDRLSDIDIFEEHVNVLIPKLGGGKEVNVVDLFFRFTLDAATHFLLGQSVDSLVNPQVKFADAFGHVQHIQSIIARSGTFNRFIPRKKFYEDIRGIDSFVQPFIERALALSPDELEKRTKSDEGYTFLHALAAFTRNRKVLRDQLINILLAGRDTTACTLSWTFYELSLYPRVTQKLRKEIEQVVGLMRKPTYEDLKSMRYLQVSLRVC